MIPLTAPDLGEEEIEAASRVLRTGMLVQGKEVAAFEQALAAYTGRAHVVAVSNGTAAIELALRVLEVGPGDEVLCPALTWPSPVHAVRALGATPVLVDVDSDEWNVSAQQLAASLSSRTRAAIVIEQFGNPARHDEIARVLRGVPVVVDAACSLGSRYDGVPCGGHGVLSTTSFHPRKVITTGEGGACFTDDPALSARLRTLRNHGQVEPGHFACASGNFRLTDLAAAIGRVQLAKLDRLCAARRRLFGLLEAALPGLSLQVTPEKGLDNRQTLGVLVGQAGSGSLARDAAIQAFSDRGVQASRLSYAVHTLSHLREEREAAELAGRELTVACDIAERGLALPLFPSMSDATMQRVIEAAREVLGEEITRHG